MGDEAEIARLARRLAGRRAFVTGAASGLGRAFALALARYGWRLGLVDLSAERLERVRAEAEAAGGRATTYAGDVAADEFVAAALGAFACDADGLDLLINNAGVAVAGPVEATPTRTGAGRWTSTCSASCTAAVPPCR